MTPLAEELTRRLEEEGWRGRIVPIERLADLERAVRGLREDGLLAEEAWRRFFGSFSYELPAEMPGARSVVVAAVPTPAMRVVFHRRGEAVPVLIPPTYVSYTRRMEVVWAFLAAWLQREGYHLARAHLPLKTLAVRSGLADYGRNNIAYVGGMGSFLELAGAFSDLPCDRDPWREPKALDRCATCIACLRKCPTGAIGEDRFLLRAERCLTYHNEAPQDFPGWIDPSWHHCLTGCMRCQTVCPENKGVADWIEDRAEFSESETDLLARAVPLDRLPPETAGKLLGLEINEEYRVLCRNLGVLLG